MSNSEQLSFASHCDLAIKAADTCDENKVLQHLSEAQLLKEIEIKNCKKRNEFFMVSELEKTFSNTMRLCKSAMHISRMASMKTKKGANK